VTSDSDDSYTIVILNVTPGRIPFRGVIALQFICLLCHS